MQSSTTQPRRRHWQPLLIAVLTAGLLWMFFRNVDLRQAWDAARRAHLWLIGLGVSVTFLTYTIRAIRWRILLAPVGPVRFRTTFRTTVIGFTAIFLLPGRVGEVLRAYLVARQENLKATSTFATVIVERLLDMVTVLLLFAVALPLVGVDVGSEIRWAGVIAAAAAVGAFGLLFLFAGHPERLGRLAGRLGRRLPRKAADMLARVVQTFAEGLAVMRSPAHLAAAAVWSVAVWLSIALGIWLATLAFDLRMSFVGSFIVVGYLAVGVSVPTPGGAGGFHLLYQLALVNFFGANRDVAAAAAIVLHLMSFVPVSIAGFVFMWQDGLTMGRLRSMRAEAQAAEKPPNP
jgi:uncharacterized protein (TIRG00374 family)